MACVTEQDERGWYKYSETVIEGMYGGLRFSGGLVGLMEDLAGETQKLEYLRFIWKLHGIILAYLNFNKLMELDTFCGYSKNSISILFN